MEHPSTQAAPWRAVPGDPLPGLTLLDGRGRRFPLGADRHAGRPLALFLCASSGAPGAAAQLQDFARRAADFEAAGLLLLGVTGASPRDNQAATAELGLPFPLLAEPGFGLGLACGLTPLGSFGGGPAWATLLVDANRRVLRVLDPAAGDDHAALALAALAGDRETAEAETTAHQPPVLLLPGLIEPALCARLIAAWETGQRYRGGVATDSGARHVVEDQVKRREDIALPDLGPEAQACFAAFRRRLFPEIRKAFQFAVTHVETLRLGCYHAAEGGHFKAHRDDTTPATAHRRFALSLNLNTGDYRGGALRFPEYGAQGYAPPAGGGVVFSCSLLHEALPVTEGRRFGLFGFFFGEAEEAERYRRNPAFESTRVDRD